MTTFELFSTPIQAHPGFPKRRAPLSLDHLDDALIRPTATAGKVHTLATQDPVLLVTTGQQAGLFTGPLYTIYKAISAAALAELLSERWSQEVKACFWIPGDDHDYVEVATASWIVADGNLVTAKLPERSAEFGLRPMYQEKLPTEIVPILNMIGYDLMGGVFAHETVEWLTRCYRPGTTLAQSFGKAMADLLAPFGVACLDGSHPSVKRQAAPLIVKYLDNVSTVAEALSQNESDDPGDVGTVSASGSITTLVFLEDGAGRDRLVYQSGNFIGRRTGEQYSLSDLKNLVLNSPERFSANVILRPIVESYLLPTVAYAGGPGELNYLNQSALVAKILDVPVQRAVPRWSGIIAEAPVQRILKKFGTTTADFISQADDIENNILISAFPDKVYDAIADLIRTFEESYSAISAGVTAIDPTMAGPVAAAQRQSDWALKDLKRQLLRSARKKQVTELSQLHRVREMLLPAGGPQERKLTVAPFFSRHGPTLLRAIFNAAKAYYQELFVEELLGSRDSSGS